jgi:hypothetical protein
MLRGMSLLPPKTGNLWRWMLIVCEAIVVTYSLTVGIGEHVVGRGLGGHPGSFRESSATVITLLFIASWLFLLIGGFVLYKAQRPLAFIAIITAFLAFIVPLLTPPPCC